ncbi:Uncharacterized protein Adt_15411 [Abeliophyllum distichum]|uniref:Uncharacterized protein n=1 Tax=Abeliophyllum distichum TaxID=126358 RepID=A0ABD1U2E5_9LAMI
MGLKSSNSLMNILVTDGANNYDFIVQNDRTKVPVKTKLTVKIVDILIDEQPLANFLLNKVLMIEELFKLAPTLALALALAPALDSLDPSKRKAQVSTRIRIGYSIPTLLRIHPTRILWIRLRNNNEFVRYNKKRFVAIILTLWW